VKVHPDFEDFVKALNLNKVDYVIVGSFALAFHGYPRATGDRESLISHRPTQTGMDNCPANLAGQRSQAYWTGSTGLARILCWPNKKISCKVLLSPVKCLYHSISPG
jgi:hypothetical protein